MVLVRKAICFKDKIKLEKKNEIKLNTKKTKGKCFK